MEGRLVYFRPRTVLVVLGVILAAALVLRVLWVTRDVLIWVAIAIFLAMAFALVGGAMLMFPRYARPGLFAEFALVLFYRHAHSRYKTDPHYFAVVWHNRGPLFRRERGPIRYLP